MDELTQAGLQVKITVLNGLQAESVFQRSHFPIIIGRSPDCDVCLNEPTLSRQHARLNLISGRLHLQDQSSNGSSTGGVPLRAGELRPLSDREEVRLGPNLRLRVETCRTTEVEPPAATAWQQDGLAIQSLGTCQIWWQGTPLPGSNWSSRKNRLLLVYLGWNQGRSLSRERICQDLWPENPQGGQQAFQSALSRLRKDLPSGDIIVCHNSLYRFHPDTTIHFDVSYLEQLVKPSATDQRLTQLTEALKLYQGPFLEGYQEAWASLRRQQLEQRYLGLLGETGLLYRQLGLASEAIPLYRQALLIEPCWEIGHQGLVQTFLDLRQRDEAVRHFHRYCKILQEQLGLPPSPEMRNLYQNATQH